VIGFVGALIGSLLILPGQINLAAKEIPKLPETFDNFSSWLVGADRYRGVWSNNSEGDLLPFAPWGRVNEPKGPTLMLNEFGEINLQLEVASKEIDGFITSPWLNENYIHRYLLIDGRVYRDKAEVFVWDYRLGEPHLFAFLYLTPKKVGNDDRLYVETEWQTVPLFPTMFYLRRGEGSDLDDFDGVNLPLIMRDLEELQSEPSAP
jgi:hypothetical protein